MAGVGGAIRHYLADAQRLLVRTSAMVSFFQLLLSSLEGLLAVYVISRLWPY